MHISETAGSQHLHGCIALVTIVTGILGLEASWPRQILGPWIHALFALLLCCVVFVRWRWLVGRSPRMFPVDIRQLSRRLSRTVYLFLYLVIGVREIVGILGSHWHGGAVDFNLFDPRFRQGPDSAAFNPKDDFQLFLASGLFALIFVRILAFRLWSRSVERGTPAVALTGIDLVHAAKLHAGSGL